MSSLNEPLNRAAAKKAVREALNTGTLSFSSHAYKEMANDGMTEVDVKNTLRGGTCVLSESFCSPGGIGSRRLGSPW